MHIMFSSLSHEFRTPLNSFANSLLLIRSIFQRIRLKISTQELSLGVEADLERQYSQVDKFLKMGLISSKVLELMVEDIMDFAKIEAGTFRLVPSKFRIEELISELSYIFTHQCEQKGVEFGIDCIQKVRQIEFLSDAGRIRQVLMNLISNSVKFTHKGYIRVNIELINSESDHPANSQGNEPERVLKFRVSDTGIGISGADQQHLFKMFETVKEHRDTINMKGTGLGLNITRKLVGVLNNYPHNNEKVEKEFIPVNENKKYMKLTSEEGIGTNVDFLVREISERNIKVSPESLRQNVSSVNES